MDVTERSLWRHGDFMKLWTGQTVSELGSVVTRTALPLVAILTLHATAIEVGLLVASASIGVIAVGLFAGALVDRSSRRPLMIAADAIRALLVLSIPVAALGGVLRIEQLYVVAFLEAALGSLFEIAYRAYLPSLLPAERLLEGNAKIGMTGAIGEIGGPGLAGALVQAITAPLAMLVDAVSFVLSALSIALIATPERRVERIERQGVRRELAEGLDAVARHPLLRPLALAAATSMLFGNFFASLYTLYALNELGLSPLMLGIVISAGGVGSLLAAWLAGPLTRRLGLGRTIVWTSVAGVPVGLLTALAAGPPLVAALFLFVPQLVGDALDSVAAIDEITLRQLVTPARLLGRVTGSLHVLRKGIAPLGALAGAAVAETFGIRTAVWIAVLGSSAGVAFLLLSPLRTLRVSPADVVPEPRGRSEA